MGNALIREVKPRYPSAKKEIQPLSNEQARALLKAAGEADDRFEAL